MQVCFLVPVSSCELIVSPSHRSPFECLFAPPSLLQFDCVWVLPAPLGFALHQPLENLNSNLTQSCVSAFGVFIRVCGAERTWSGKPFKRVNGLRLVEGAGHGLQMSCCQAVLTSKQCQRGHSWTREKKDWTTPQWSKVLLSDGDEFCMSLCNKGPGVGRRSERSKRENA